METSILMKSGTNELEIIEMAVGSSIYGVNVAKVREIILPQKVVEIPKVHPAIEGIFYFRGAVLPVINLEAYIEKTSRKPSSSEGKWIIMEFNRLLCGFRVSNVHRIRRISWNNIETPGEIIASENSSITGVVKLLDDETGKEKIVMMVDFEKIVADIEPDTSFGKITSVGISESIDRGTKRILVAEDSKMIRMNLVNSLKKSGYVNISVAKNGLEAWNILKNSLAENVTNPNWKITNVYNMVVTDVEMPQMDGHHLIYRIRNDKRLSKLPVIIFSSLANEENIKKGREVGADGQVPKPRVNDLIKLIDKLII